MDWNDICFAEYHKGKREVHGKAYILCVCINLWEPVCSTTIICYAFLLVLSKFKQAIKKNRRLIKITAANSRKSRRISRRSVDRFLLVRFQVKTFNSLQKLPQLSCYHHSWLTGCDKLHNGRVLLFISYQWMYRSNKS